MILLNILIPLIVAIFGYLLGSIPSGIIIGKIFFHQDPRDFGSHNSGGTNASRLWGFKYGFLVYLFDFLKVLIGIYGCWTILTFIPFDNGHGLIPSFNDFYSNNISSFIIQYPVYWIVIPFAALGHCFPLFAQFKGGKAASVTFSSMIFTSWFTGLIAISTFYITLQSKKYVSLSSILGSLITAILSWLTMIPQLGQIAMFGPTLKGGLVFAICLTITSILLTIRHTSNIKRLKAGTERKITWLK